MPNNIIRQDYGALGNDVQTQMLIAPVLAEMVATQAFAIDDQFIVDNVLYKATKAIAIGDAISVGTSTTDNCILSDSITQQMKSGGWTDCSDKFQLASGATGTFVAYENDEQVIIRGNVTQQNNYYGDLVLVRSGNSGYYPKFTTIGNAFWLDNSLRRYVGVTMSDANGSIYFVHSDTSITNKAISFTVIYIKSNA